MGEGTTGRRRRFESEAVPFMQPLYCTALHLTHNAADAGDLVQETYLRAYRSFEQFTPGTNCKAWLFTIMHSIFNTAYRKTRREQEGMQMLALEAQLETGLALPIQAVADPEVEQALRQLPEEFRLTVLLVDVGELSYEEAAKVLHCPVGTVRSRLSRARKLLFAALQSYARATGYPVAPEQA